MTTIGSYEVVRELGRAPRSTLYVGRRISDGLEVILKEFVIPTATPVEFREKFLARYLEECDWLRRCKHPNVVDVLDVIAPAPDRPTPVLVTEALGKSLQNVISEKAALDPQDVVSWMIQILTGVRALHDRQIIHRDIKPSNVMFDAAGRPKIIDLGIAVQIGQEMTLAPEDVSTQYAAPELYRGRAGANFATDIYSIGFMAYQLLCGQDKFYEQFHELATGGDRENLLRWMNWHCDTKSKLIPLKDVLPAFPEYLSDVIAAMTAKDLAQRYQTVPEVLEALLHQSNQHDDVFSLLIRQYISTDYWREPAAYKLDPDAVRGTLSTGKHDGVDGGLDSRKTKKKILLLVAAGASTVLTIVLVILLFLIARARQTDIDNTVWDYYSRCLSGYEASDYPQTRAIAGEGVQYINDIGQDGTFREYLAFFDLVGKDAAWIEGLEEQVKKGVEIVELEKAKPQGQADMARLTEAKQIAEALLKETYERGDREDALDRLTAVKITSVKDRAKQLLGDVEALIPPPAPPVPPDSEVVEKASAAEKAGKFRQALYLLLMNKATSDSANAVKEKLGSVVKELDNGRDAFDQRRLPEAQSAFQHAWDLSERQSLEAAYYLQQINVALLGSLDPASAIDWRTLDVDPGSIERRLLESLVAINAYFIQTSDLSQTGHEADLQSVVSVSDALLIDLQNLIQKQQASAAPFYDAKPLDEIRYPIEDSRGYFANLLADLLRQKYKLALDLGQPDAARELLAQVQSLIPAIEYDFHQAAILISEDVSSKKPGAADKAIQAFNRILSQNANWAECHFRLGCLYYLSDVREDYDKAIRSLKQARTLLPQNERYRWWSARVANDYGAKLIDSGDCDGAVRSNEEALEIWPDFPAAWFGLGHSYRCQGNEAEAERAFEKFRAAVKARTYVYAPEQDYLDILDGKASVPSGEEVAEGGGLLSESEEPDLPSE